MKEVAKTKNKNMLQTQFKRSIFMGVTCSLLLLFGGVVVHSSQPAVLDDDERVIVKSSFAPERSLRRIGNTDYYVMRAVDARMAQHEFEGMEAHVPQTYTTTATNDPLEPQEYLTLLNAADMWDITTGNAEVVVAVVDSGFALEHEDLLDRWFINEAEYGPTLDEGPEPNCTSRGLELDKSCNNLDDSGNGLIDDWRGWDFANDENDVSAGLVSPEGSAVTHGTAVSGMVGATGNNGAGVASINWATTILPIQVFTDDGAATTEELADGIAYAIEMGADVINLSLGSAAMDPVIEDLLQNAWNENIVVVAAAGNCGGSSYELNGCSFEGQMLYPATSDLTIAVAGTDMNDVRAVFSSEGAMVDLAAPATGAIRTTLYDADNEAGAYSGGISGTSFATPIVSGLVASMRALVPDASPRDIRNALIDSTRRISDMDGAPFTEQHGFGRVQPAPAANRVVDCQNTTLQADINCDGVVDLLDLSVLATLWQIERTGRADMNEAGITDLLDLSILASEWGQTE